MQSAILIKRKDNSIAHIIAVSSDDYEEAIEICEDLKDSPLIVDAFTEALDNARIDYYFMDYSTMHIK